MKCEIKDKWKNNLMKRDEVLVHIDHEGSTTPNRKEIMEESAKLLKTKPDQILVTKILTSGGKAFTEARVYSYFSKEDIPEWKVKKYTERIGKIKGPAPAEEKPSEGAAESSEKAADAENPQSEDKPVEDKSDQKPTEEPPSPSEESADQKKEEEPEIQGVDQKQPEETQKREQEASSAQKAETPVEEKQSSEATDKPKEDAEAEPENQPKEKKTDSKE